MCTHGSELFRALHAHIKSYNDQCKAPYDWNWAMKDNIDVKGLSTCNSGICSCVQWLCISRFVVTYSMSCLLVDFFSLHKYNTTLHKFLITGAQILFHRAQIKKLTRSHFYSYCCSIFGAKHIRVPISNNVWTKLWTKCEYAQIWLWTCAINVQCM